MAATIKGLLKGLRFITQIFDEEKEQEMQIGFPTDVKHVAHIGCDGPSGTTPSWINDFKSPELQSSPDGSNGEEKDCTAKYPIEDTRHKYGVGLQELLPPTQSDKPKHKSRRKSTGAGSPPSSPTKRTPPEVPKPSRRHHSSHNSVDSSEKDSSSKGRKHRHHHRSSSGGDPTDSSHKHSTHKKTKSKGGESGSKYSKCKDESSSQHSKSKDEGSSLRGTCSFATGDGT